MDDTLFDAGRAERLQRFREICAATAVGQVCNLPVPDSWRAWGVSPLIGSDVSAPLFPRERETDRVPSLAGSRDARADQWAHAHRSPRILDTPPGIATTT